MKLRWPRLSFVRGLGLLIFVLAMAVILIGYPITTGAPWTLERVISELYSNLGTELLSIAITILVIDWLNERRQTEEKKQELIRELSSPTNAFALRAARELQVCGWLEDGTLRGADLRKANLVDAQMDKADLENANLWEADLENIRLREANLRGARLGLANLESSLLEKVDLEDADLWEANLTSANLRGSNLRDADLRGSTLVQVTLSRTNLTGTFLQDSTIEGVDLKGALYDNTTVWPEGFDPKAAGATNVDEQETEPGP